MPKTGTGSVMDPAQLSLTTNQRIVYNRLLAQGQPQSLARQIAISVAKADGVTPPSGVQAACKRGLELAPKFGGAGLTDGAKARARSMAAGNAVSPDQIRRMKSYFARHDNYAKDSGSEPSPGYVAWQLWGGDAGKRWAESQADRLEKSAERVARVRAAEQARGRAREAMAKADAMPSGYHKAFADAAKAILPQGVVDTLHKRARAVAGGQGAAQRRRDLIDQAAGGAADANQAPTSVVAAKADGQKPLGAAFSHARASGKKQDEESRKRRANAYLEANGHEKIGKAAPAVEDVRQEAFIDAKAKRKRKDGDTDAKREDVKMSARIVKAEDVGWKKLVWSVVYEPDTEDTHGDFMSAETIEKAAHGAMREGIYINREHAGAPLGAHVVESYIAPCDMTFVSDGQRVDVRKGSWVMGMQIETDDLWGEVLDGTFTGFSLEGTAAVPAAA